MKPRYISGTYKESDASDTNRTPRPIPAEGIGRRIGEAAALLGTRSSAYSIMGISSAALQRYIKEENAAPFDALARLCMATDTSMEWLATGEGSRKASQRLFGDICPALVLPDPVPSSPSIRKAAYASTSGNFAKQRSPESEQSRASQPVRQETLMIALQLADEALQGKVLATEKRAELVSLIYEMLEEGLPDAKVLRFARAVGN